MLIGVDARGTEVGFKSHYGRGTGRYAENLIRELTELVPELVLPIYQKDLCPSGFKKLLSYTPIAKNTIESQLISPLAIKKLKITALHFLSQTDTIHASPVPYAVSVLDLIPLRFPELYSGDGIKGIRYKFARYLEELGIKKSRGFIAISEATKRDLVELLKIPSEKIYVTHLGLEDKFINTEFTPEIRALKKYEARMSLNLDNDYLYLIYVGGIDPRKNIKFLLEVLAELKERFLKVKLLMVGNLKREKEYDNFRSTVFDLRLNSNVVETGYVDDQKLIKYYEASDLMLFPSLYEGFGFPVLEASAMGVPVICNKNSSLTEIMEGCGIVIDNFDVNNWCDKAQGVLFNPDLNLSLIDQGIKRAKSFSWSATANATLKAYEALFLKDLK